MVDDEANSILMAPALTVVAPPSLKAQGGASRSTSIATTLPPVFLAYKSEDTKLSAYRSETMKLPILMSRTSSVISAPVEAVLAPRSSSPCHWGLPLSFIFVLSGISFILFALFCSNFIPFIVL